jgi:AraC family transcriptional regulator of adaptative response/methylated-DNA-[protein]-cysteine methyltransferase
MTKEPAMLDLESCWTAVANRDRGADGKFLYGVKTVGVYCRPGCPSRRPNRENAVFFADAAAAEKAGYRPCKRCRPAEPAPDARQRQAVEKACRIIRDSDTPPALAALAREVGFSPYHFHRLFRRIVGTTPRDYAQAQRLGRLAGRLDDGDAVSDAIYAAGFGSSARAYDAAPAGLGMTPGAWRKGGAGETIRFATARCALGWALIAATARGICATALGDDRAMHAAELRRRFPAATLVEDAAALRPWADAFVRFVDRPDSHAPDLPLDIAGTAFQARVWRALRGIPAGETMSYAAIAEAIGQPTASRAVARACATNPIAVLVPCHRVIGRDGALTGYRWGIERKKKLLQHEAAMKNGKAESGR